MRIVFFFFLLITAQFLFAQKLGNITSLVANISPITIFETQPRSSSPPEGRFSLKNESVKGAFKTVCYALSVHLHTTGFEEGQKVIIKAESLNEQRAMINEVYYVGPFSNDIMELHLKCETAGVKDLTTISAKAISINYKLNPEDKQKFKYITVTILDKENREISTITSQIL